MLETTLLTQLPRVDGGSARARASSRKPLASMARGRLRPLLTIVLLAVIGFALAHSEWETGSPGPDAVLDAPPAEVVLTFSEPVDTRFSLFKVYPLTTDVTAGDGDVLEADEAARLEGLAATLVDDVLTARGDEGERVDVGLVDTTELADRVTLALEPDLPAGAYVVMWSVLAEDTHAVQGHYVIVVSTSGP